MRFLLASLLLAGSLVAQAPPPNVLLIVSEDNGPELGCYGDPYARTPNLDRLARGGVRFENAFVPYSVCSPSRACYLTGLYPQQNGQLGLATHKFAMYRHWESIPSHLRRIGYLTGLIGKLHVNPEKAFPFDYRRIRGANFGKRDMAQYAQAAGEFFRQSDRPFFLSINYPDAHYPLHRQQFGRPAQPVDAGDVRPLSWVGADSPRLRKFTANYYNCLMRLDDGIGLLLDELEKAGKTQNTLVFYLGDHGAQFSRGKCSVYEAGLRIPLLVSWPGQVRKGHIAPELVSSLDILPTILRAVGIEVRDLPGKPLQPLLAGRNEVLHEHVFGITTGAAPGIAYLQFSVRDRRHKLIWNPRPKDSNLFAQAYLAHKKVHFRGGTGAEEIAAAPPLARAAYARFAKPPRYELYDLEKDPDEFENLADDDAHRSIRERLLKALRAWQEEIDDPFLEPENLELFVREQTAARTRNYRKDKSFRWGYLDRFAAWRRARADARREAERKRR